MTPAELIAYTQLVSALINVGVPAGEKLVSALISAYKTVNGSAAQMTQAELDAICDAGLADARVRQAQARAQEVPIPVPPTVPASAV